MDNPFVYGEVVPDAAFVDREVELDRLVRDLLAGQKVFLISPRRYGKSSLVRQALASAGRAGALAVSVTVSSYSSYVAFLEGYARALVSVESRVDRARKWLREMLGTVRPEVRVEPARAARQPSRWPSRRPARTRTSRGWPRRCSPCRVDRRRARPHPRRRADEFRRSPRSAPRGAGRPMAQVEHAARRRSAPAAGRLRLLGVGRRWRRCSGAAVLSQRPAR